VSKAGRLLPRGGHGGVTRPTQEGWHRLASMGLRKGLWMLVEWETAEGEVHRAERTLGGCDVLHLQVESLGEIGWDWHVWEQSGRGQQRYGLADSLTDAKEKAEAALDALAWDLGLAA